MTRTHRHLVLLGASALAPITLGIAMHLEHQAAVAACEAGLATWSAPLVEAQPLRVLTVPTPIVVVSPPAAEAEPPSPPVGALDFAFVIDIDGPHVVLATAPDEAWASGAPRYLGAVHDIYEVGEVWRPVHLDRLPSATRAAIGRELDVYSASGRTCTARVGAPSLVGELSGSIDYAAEEDIEIGADGTSKTIPARAAWEDSRHLLVAPLLDASGCVDGLWARDAELARPLVYAAQDPSVAPSELAKRTMLRAPAGRELAAAFAKHMANASTEDGPAPRLRERLVGRRWLGPSRGAELDVFTTDGEEFGVCGGFDFAWGAVTLDAAGTRASSWLDTETDSVRAVVDLDADGNPEVIAETYLGPTRVFTLGADHGMKVLAELPELPFHGCPC